MDAQDIYSVNDAQKRVLSARQHLRLYIREIFRTELLTEGAILALEELIDARVELVLKLESKTS